MKTMVSTAASGHPGVLERADVLPVGAKAGPWIVERELGRGGMGAVYAVVHEDIGKRAALKIVHQRLLVPRVTCDRMLLEARVVNQVGHPNIVDIFETGKLADGRPYIVMERLDGQTLSDRAQAGKLPPDLVIAILLQICDALIAAHAAGVIHRDLKLENVFLIDAPDDPAIPKAKLLDWGIAKVISVDARQTVDGQLVGTPQYLSPEQARGLVVTPQTDVYSLGVMAYELFLAQLPFEAETAAEVMALHLRAAPPPPCELWPDVPPDLEDLLLAMLAKQPEQRPPMREVARRLEVVREALERRRADDMPALVTLRPSTAERPEPAAAGLVAAEPARWATTRKRWQYALGALALAVTAVMVWISRLGAPAVAAAVHPELVAAPVADRLRDLAPAEAPDLVATRAPELPTTRPVEERERAPLRAAADRAKLAAPATRPSGAPRPQAQGPRGTARNEALRGPDRSVARGRPRLTASRPAPAHGSLVAPRRGDQVDPDGTLDAYR